MNDLPSAAAEERLFEAFAHRGWAARVAAGRPYRDFAQLMAAADDAWSSLGDEDWLQAFAAHPRIGESGGSIPAVSSAEQARVATASPRTLSALEQENREYEARFGRVFLIAAEGRTADEILAALRERMHNDPRAEMEVAAGEQRKITRLRLGRRYGR